jgi:hypothetical protein
MTIGAIGAVAATAWSFSAEREVGVDPVQSSVATDGCGLTERYTVDLDSSHIP